MRGSSRDRLSSVYVGVFGSLALLVGYFGCSKDNQFEPTDASGPAVTGAGAGSSCQNGVPDGYCIAEGSAMEDCTCEDCAIRAVCNDGCNDDNACTAGQEGSSEDCSCGDCFNKVYRDGAECAPDPQGCDDEPGCQTSEDCVCPDCENDPACQNCVNNGNCVQSLESCSCPDCQGNCFSTSTSGGNPNGGNGGVVAGGNGGNGGNGGAISGGAGAGG